MNPVTAYDNFVTGATFPVKWFLELSGIWRSFLTRFKSGMAPTRLRRGVSRR